jgi:hypothetical protein
MKNLKFIHITKTGGTSIEDAGFSKRILWGRFDTEYTGGILGNWHKPFSLIDDNIKNKYDWFTVVRNPYTRIVSEFYCKYTTPVKKYVSIPEYNSIIRNNILNRTSPKMGFHYTEQYLYLDKVINIHIIKFENLLEEFNELINKYNLALPPLFHNNVGNKQYSIEDLDKDTIDLINDIYHRDFIEFNYEKR